MNSCQRCGACCAMFCVAFPESEADDLPGGWVPTEMTEVLAGHRRAMRGTRGSYPRCAALFGTIGSSVRCTIYENRPTICRAFTLSWQDNRENFLCNQARAAYGLPHFSP